MYSRVMADDDRAVVIGTEHLGRLFDDGVVLNVCKAANADEVHVAANGGAIPNGGIVPDLTEHKHENRKPNE